MYYCVLVDHNAYHICVMSKILGYQLPYHYWICAKFITEIVQLIHNLFSQMYISRDGQLHCSGLVSKTPERRVACRQSVLVPSFPHQGDIPFVTMQVNVSLKSNVEKNLGRIKIEKI